MKKLIVLLVVCLLISGCIDAGYRHKTYDSNGKLIDDLQVSHRMANVNESTGNVIIKLADGTVIALVSNAVVADPNSAKAEAELVTAIGGLFVPSIKLK